jgi:hypothetical protein
MIMNNSNSTNIKVKIGEQFNKPIIISMVSESSKFLGFEG